MYTNSNKGILIYQSKILANTLAKFKARVSLKKEKMAIKIEKGIKIKLQKNVAIRLLIGVASGILPFIYIMKGKNK